MIYVILGKFLGSNLSNFEVTQRTTKLGYFADAWLSSTISVASHFGRGRRKLGGFWLLWMWSFPRVSKRPKPPERRAANQVVKRNQKVKPQQYMIQKLNLQKTLKHVTWLISSSSTISSKAFLILGGAYFNIYVVCQSSIYIILGFISANPCWLPSHSLSDTTILSPWSGPASVPFNCSASTLCEAWRRLPRSQWNLRRRRTWAPLLFYPNALGLVVFGVTLLRVIPTMTFIRFVTGKSSGILSDISSGILSGISSGILSGILSGISSGISSGNSSGILSGKHSGTLSGISSGILSDILSDILAGKSSGIPSGILSGISCGILSGISSGILSGKSSGILSDILSGVLSDISFGILSGISSGILSGISSGILSGISSGTLSGISSGILSGKHSGTLSGIFSGVLSDILSGILSGKSSGILSGILSGISSGILSGISSGILSGRWGPAVGTELGRSQVEVQRCALSWEGPRLTSSSAPELGRSQVEVQRCALSWEGRKWRWKLMQTWSRRNWRRRRSRRRSRRRRRRRRRTTALIKSNNPHLAGGEKIGCMPMYANVCHRMVFLLIVPHTWRQDSMVKSVELVNQESSQARFGWASELVRYWLLPPRGYLTQYIYICIYVYIYSFCTCKSW